MSGAAAVEAAAEAMGKAMIITEWQYRMPEDRRSEDGWMDNTEAGASYLQRESGAEVRTRTVTEWTTK